MKHFFVSVILFAALIFSGCSTQLGGTLSGFDKEPVPNTLVKLIVIDDEGTEIEDVGFSITNDKGKFNFGYTDSLGSSFVVEAVLLQGTIRGFAMGNGSRTDLNPITDAIVRAVIYVTETEGGRSLSDFSRKELRKIISEVLDSQTLWDASFTDIDALVNLVIETAGRLIPDAAGGSINALNLASISAPNLNTGVPDFENLPDDGCGDYAYAITGNMFTFSITEDARTCVAYSGLTGAEGTFSGIGGSRLLISGDTFPVSGTQFPGEDCELNADPCPAFSFEDTREFVFGPMTSDGGLNVTRKLYIPESSDYMRYLEIFSNPTDADKEIDIKIFGELGLGGLSGSEGIAILADSNGDGLITSSDSYGANFDKTGESIPSVGFVWDGISAKDRADVVSFPPSNDVYYEYSWENVIIPAQSTKVFMHFGNISPSKVPGDFDDFLGSFYENPDETGMSKDELNNLQNFQVNVGNVSGDAGSVSSFAALTVTNTTINESMTLTAHKDGSFAVNLSADSGNTVTIIGNDLTDVTLTVP